MTRDALGNHRSAQRAVGSIEQMIRVRISLSGAFLPLHQAASIAWALERAYLAASSQQLIIRWRNLRC
jgi:hypothetical protein